MLKGLLKLSWIEMKIFLREPMGVVGSLVLPVLLFVFVGRALRFSPRSVENPISRLPFNIAILTALLISLGAVQSLVAIMAIYREGGILKRLRATPLSPVAILGAHVFVKLAFTLLAMVVMILAGRPSHGKSALALQIAIHAALKGSPAMVASLEMADDENGERALAAAAKVELDRVISGNLESSNTDIAEEFSKMIVTQQAYSANTRVVSTSQQMLSDVLNMVR